MRFYEVIYENPGVEKARARKRSHQLPSLWGQGEGDLSCSNLIMLSLGVMSSDMEQAKQDLDLKRERERERARNFRRMLPCTLGILKFLD